jgi:hypothetical protein
MRKPFLIATTILIVIFIIQPITQMPYVNGWLIAPTIQVNSPLPSFMDVYHNTTVPLSVEVRILDNSPSIQSVYYTLDGNTKITLKIVEKRQEDFAPNKIGFALIANTTLENLSNGNHTLRVYSLDVNGGEMSSEQTFTVDTTFRHPTVTIISPLNQTYTQAVIPLVYSVDNGTVDFAFYRLDQYENNFLYGNSTLSGLTEGSHSIYIWVDTDKGSASEVCFFNVNTTQANSYTLDTQTSNELIAVISVITVIAVAVILYKKKIANK